MRLGGALSINGGALSTNGGALSRNSGALSRNGVIQQGIAIFHYVKGNIPIRGVSTEP